MKILKPLCAYTGLISSIGYFFLQKYGLMQFSPIIDILMGGVTCGSGAALHMVQSPIKK